jgi:predicted HAD superfamily Cof-like phosphohydrolase
MQAALDQVREFHGRIGAQIADRPGLLACDKQQAELIAAALRRVLEQCHAATPPPDSLASRLALAVEELAEWVEAHAAGDLTAAADAWGDRLYVLLGDAIATGLPGPAIFEEVHRSNMTKAERKSDGFGKALKGQSYVSPTLRFGDI